MESINFIKGYGKVIPSEEDPNSSQKRTSNHRRRRIIAISSVIFLTIAVASLSAALIHESTTESEESETQPQLSSNSALKTVCSVTLHPDSCFSAISPLNTPPISNSPLHFFNLSLQATIHEVSNLSSLPRNLIKKDSPALKDCADLFSEAASQLEKSAALTRVNPGEKVFTEMKISDIQTWVSAAMTDLQTCIDGLEETGSTAVDQLKTRVLKSQEYMSNTLAILNHIQSLYDKFGLTMP
ncbi:pectinesterase/pectinesterase inhibitor 26 [Dorcoceras hygrometricum]|uniref:pectinesterase n=1 Tax=Dorcoceras hygrometricum TaxID=472368 RepID=A0A2Z7D497_9LAMI|nr:pectinesterase/pectinesterase inhibitor 26 [Dorcoceras hygrometricum]